MLLVPPRTGSRPVSVPYNLVLISKYNFFIKSHYSDKRVLKVSKK